MAQIILVWGVHPNESEVTHELAKMLQRNLAKRGHEAKVVKYPENLTIVNAFENFARAASEKPEQWAAFSEEQKLDAFHAAREKEQKGYSTFLKRLAFRNPKAIIFDLHTTRIENYAVKTTRHPRLTEKVNFWNTRAVDSFALFMMHEQSPMLPMAAYAKNTHIIELPAEYVKSTGSLRNLCDKCQVHLPFESGEEAWSYLNRCASIKKTKAANFLSPTTVAKLGHAIDRTVNTMRGVYRKPKGVPFRPKAKKPSAAEIARRRSLKMPK